MMLLAGLSAIGGLVYADVKATVTPEPERPVEQKVVELHMTTNRIVIEESKKKRSSKELPLSGGATCSGAFIDDMGDILTARHCVEGFDVFEVVTFDQRKYRGVVIATSTVHDLALIHIDRVNTAYFKLAKSVTRGESISALGSPLGLTNTLSQGTIAKLDGDVFMMDLTVLPGNSGGPVFNAEGNMVGVATAMFVVLLGPTHLTIAQGNEAIWFFLVSVFSRK